jgi:hypothetical protein
MNGAQRQRAMLLGGMTMREVYTDVVAQTRESYAGLDKHRVLEAE